MRQVEIAMERAGVQHREPAEVALSTGQFVALRNLAIKQAGGDVDWINIGDARALTELGLAERNREGWNITEAGAELLKVEVQDKVQTNLDNRSGQG